MDILSLDRMHNTLLLPEDIIFVELGEYVEQVYYIKGSYAILM